MSIGTADLITAINSAWDGSGLNGAFQALWPSGTSTTQFPVLHDEEAGPGQPFPYCVMELETPRVETRMSNTGNFKRELRSAIVRFNIHAKEVTGDSRSVKQIAACLAEEVVKVFGGHTTSAPATLTLASGQILPAQYVTDYGHRTELDNYQWVIEYLFRIDVPVAV